MNRISPTDPPDEPVNRIAGAMAAGEAKLDAALSPFSPEKAREENAKLTHLREAFASLLEVYHTDPEGNHRDAAAQFAKKHFGGPEALLIMFRPITQKPTGRLAQAMIKILFGPQDFARHHAAVVQRIIRDLEKPETYEVIRPQ